MLPTALPPPPPPRPTLANHIRKLHDVSACILDSFVEPTRSNTEFRYRIGRNLRPSLRRDQTEISLFGTCRCLPVYPHFSSFQVLGNQRRMSQSDNNSNSTQGDQQQQQPPHSQAAPNGSSLQDPTDAPITSSSQAEMAQVSEYLHSRV